MFSLPEAVSIWGYQIVTGIDNEEHHGRNPESWTLYGSSDYDTLLLDGTWETIHSVEHDERLEDINNELYQFETGETKAYKYYKLVIHENEGNEIVQIADFNLLYDGCYTYEDADRVREWTNLMKGIKVQGSVNGTDWITLFRFPEIGDIAMSTYVIERDVMSNIAWEYAFTQFRLINDTNNDLNIAEVKFYGEEAEATDLFPTADKITEPLFSVVGYNRIMDWAAYNCGDGEFLWGDGNDETPDVYNFFNYAEGVAFHDQIPVMIIDALFPAEFDGKLVIPDTMTIVDDNVSPVLGVAPYAFQYNFNFTSVEFGKWTRDICEWAFAHTDPRIGCNQQRYPRNRSESIPLAENLTEFTRLGEPLTDEQKHLQHGRWVDVYDGFLYRDNLMLYFPMNKSAGGSYTIPDFIEIIGDHAMLGNKLTSLDLGNGVKEVYYAGRLLCTSGSA